jgi:tetratricopeptide (TPR) repeat protein
MTSPRSDGRDVPDREALEEERDFLLKSLDDLEAERESGAMDDESYAELHDDYTARAAAVIRTLRDGVDSRPEPVSASSPRRRVAVIAGIVVVAIVAGGALAGALGARLPGETSSGNTRSDEEVTAKRLARTIKTLQERVNANPDDYDSRLALAHAYEAVGDYRNALEQSDAAITIDATRPAAHANAGRLLYLASEGVNDETTRDQFIAEANAAFNTSLERDPEYSPAYFFRAILELFATQQLERAQADLQLYIIKAPNGPYVDKAREALAQVTAALGTTSTTVPTSP